MGPVGDAHAVVDQYGCVHGVEALRVADASIMPNIPRAKTNRTCIVIGERIAGWMRSDRLSKTWERIEPHASGQPTARISPLANALVDEAWGACTREGPAPAARVTGRFLGNPVK
jgi:choline dehydrogenase-like flavoprotein